jgi:hypothetical protein
VVIEGRIPLNSISFLNWRFFSIALPYAAAAWRPIPGSVARNFPNDVEIGKMF